MKRIFSLLFCLFLMGCKLQAQVNISFDKFHDMTLFEGETIKPGFPKEIAITALDEKVSYNAETGELKGLIPGITELTLTDINYPCNTKVIKVIVKKIISFHDITLFEGETIKPGFPKEIAITALDEKVSYNAETGELKGLIPGITELTLTDILDETNKISIVITVRAQYKIIYHLNGGENNPDNPEKFTGRENIILKPASKKDYDFKGWYDNAGFTGSVVTVIPMETAEDKELFAYFEIKDSVKIDNTRQNLAVRFQKLGRIDDDIVLITEDPEWGTSISYVSDKPEILDNKGFYHYPYKDDTVTYTVTIKSGNISRDFTFHVLVKGYYKPLKNIITGYVYTEIPSIDDNLFDTLDIINCAFVKADKNGNLSGNILKKAQNYIIPKAKQKGCYVLITIGPDSEWTSFADPSKNLIDQFAGNIVNLINKYGFDGVDIDWEFPKDGQETWFTSLMKAVYVKVKANNSHHLVTAAIGGGKWQPKHYDLNNAKNYLDYINLMCYSMSSSAGQYQNALYASKTKNNPIYKVGYTLSSCSIDESVKFYYDHYQIGPEKLLPGIPFFGRKQIWEQNEWKKSKALHYTVIKSFRESGEYKYVFDTIAKVPYLLSNDGTIFISYEDPTSIKEKCLYIRNKGLAGIMYWQNGQDKTGDLLNALKKGMK